jgi:hypothetical protein
MALGVPVNAAAIVAAGKDMTREFWDEFVQPDLGEGLYMNMIMRPSRQGVAKQEQVGWFGAAPNIAYWEDGDPIPSGNMDSFVGSIVHKAFAIKVPFTWDDVKYDRTESLREMAQESAKTTKRLDVRALFQFINNAVDNTLYPSVPLAFDGALMYAALAGGANRFGVSGGNIVTGAYMDSAAEALNGLTAAYNRACSFLNTEGQPKQSANALKRMVVIWPQQYAQVLQQALGQQITSNDAGTAGVSNYILDGKLMGIGIGGFTIYPWITPMLTAKEFFVFFPDVKRAFGRSDVEPLMEMPADFGNSDTAREYKQFSLNFHMLCGHYLPLPYGTVNVVDA